MTTTATPVHDGAPQPAAPPGKLSELVRTAIDDARNLPRDEYRPDAGIWHDPGDPEGEPCHVCLAGAVIARTLAVPASEYMTPTDYAQQCRWTARAECWRYLLRALEDVRRGQLLSAKEKFRHGIAIDRGEGEGEHATFASELPREDTDRLLKIAGPRQVNFRGWPEMDNHLQSLDEMADQLEAAGF